MYVRPHLDYGDVIYHNQRANLMDLLEQVQYKAALVVSGCWQGTSLVKIYSELGWESLSDRRWLRWLTCFYKIVNKLTPAYLYEHLLPPSDIKYNLRHRRNFKNMNISTERYRNSFFPYCTSEWEKLSDEIKSLPKLSQFKKIIGIYSRP